MNRPKETTHLVSSEMRKLYLIPTAAAPREKISFWDKPNHMVSKPETV